MPMSPICGQLPQYVEGPEVMSSPLPTSPSRSHSGVGISTTLIASTAALGGFLFGFDSGVINGTVTALAESFGSDAAGTGFSVASMLLGCAFGALLAGPASDRAGRRLMMLVTAVAFALSAWGSGVADGTAEFVLFRLVGGVAVGSASVLTPAYISEVAPPELRGRLASLQQLAIVLGIFGAFLSNYAIAQASGGASQSWFLGYSAWRWMFWTEILPACAFFVGALLIPESPRFLVAVGRVAEGRQVFARLMGEEQADGLVHSVQSTVSAERRPRMSDLIDPTSRRLSPIVWVGILLSIFQQFVGINVVFYYGAVLWRAAGFSEAEALQVNLISGTVNVLSTFVAMALIDRLGRKPLLLAGSAGMAVALLALGACFAQGTLGPDGALRLSGTVAFAALIFANLYIFCFGVSWGPCVWVLLGEMFPNRIRGAALSVSASAQWVANFTVTMTFPLLLAGLGLALSYGIYGTFAVLSLFFVLRFVRETRGRALEEMGRGAS